MKRIMVVSVLAFSLFAVGCASHRAVMPSAPKYRNITVSEVEYREVTVIHGSQLPWSTLLDMTLFMEWTVQDTIRGEEVKYPSMVRLMGGEELPEGDFGQHKPVYKTTICVSLPAGTSRRAWKVKDFSCDNLLREELVEFLIGVEEDVYYFTSEVEKHLPPIDQELTSALEKLAGVEVE